MVLGIVGFACFLVTGVLQTSAESMYPRVQWVREGRPDGEIERARIDGLPTIPGTGPEGSVFVDRSLRPRSRPFSAQAGIYLLARLGCVGAVLTAVFGFFAHRRVERSLRIARGEPPL